MRAALPAAMLLIAASSSAVADSMVITLSETGFVNKVFSAPGADSLSVPLGTPFGNYNSNGIDAIAAPLAPGTDELSTNTINVSSAGSATALTIDIVASNVSDIAKAAVALDSFFSVTGITSGWTVTGETLVNGVMLSGSGLLVANSALTKVGTANLTGIDSFEAIYTIASNGIAGALNGGIDITAVPGPVIGGGLPGLVFGFLGLGILSRRKRKMQFTI